MVYIPLYNIEGREIEKLEVSEAIFSVSIKPGVIHQVFVAERANRRVVLGHAKRRGEVRGGGRKPWRQKGTGRARQGSIRSPLWVGGGVTFGPNSERNFSQKINRKTRQGALKMILSDKVGTGKVLALEHFSFSEVKTKQVATLRGMLPGKNKQTLFLTGSYQPLFFRMTRNIPGVSVEEARNLSVYDALSYEYLIIEKEALRILERRLSHDVQKKQV